MAEKFPGPTYTRLIDKSPDIVKVGMDNMDIGARPSAMPKNTKNDMTIRHVKG